MLRLHTGCRDLYAAPPQPIRGLPQASTPRQLTSSALGTAPRWSSSRGLGHCTRTQLSTYSGASRTEIGRAAASDAGGCPVGWGRAGQESRRSLVFLDISPSSRCGLARAQVAARAKASGGTAVCRSRLAMSYEPTRRNGNDRCVAFSVNARHMHAISGQGQCERNRCVAFTANARRMHL